MKWRVWEKGVFMAWGKIYDFPPRGKIYLKPFFCLKRCYGWRFQARLLFFSRFGPLGSLPTVLCKLEDVPRGIAGDDASSRQRRRGRVEVSGSERDRERDVPRCTHKKIPKDISPTTISARAKRDFAYVTLLWVKNCQKIKIKLAICPSFPCFLFRGGGG